MGIYDRDYYRREGPSFLGSFLERGTVCTWLVGINVVAFIVQMLTRVQGVVVVNELGLQLPGGWEPGPFTQALWLDVPRVLHGEVWRLLTYAFLHDTANIWHILFNMLFLWWFGSDLEDLYGPREFLTFYLTAAVVAGLTYTAAAVLGIHPESVALGASGGVTAVLVLCACHFPRRVIYLFLFLPVPIWAFVVFSVVQDMFGVLGGSHNGVASSAHLGGAAFGFLYYKLHWRLSGLLPRLGIWKRRLAQPRLRVYREEEHQTPVSVAAPAAASGGDDEQLEAKMDAILEKISRVGKENLTENELQVLRRASEKFKRRRT
jgi:membrane associated rhomboid family serine protease